MTYFMVAHFVHGKGRYREACEATFAAHTVIAAHNVMSGYSVMSGHNVVSERFKKGGGGHCHYFSSGRSSNIACCKSGLMAYCTLQVALPLDRCVCPSTAWAGAGGGRRRTGMQMEFTVGGASNL